jgi:hypothetical protein
VLLSYAECCYAACHYAECSGAFYTPVNVEKLKFDAKYGKGEKDRGGIHKTTYKLLTIIMEQRTFKNVSNYLNANIYSYIETSGGQSSNLYLNVVHFFNSRVN